jgi:GTP-binding protein Era
MDADGVIQRSGFVAVVGRPNVGKSSLINRVVGRKVSITSRRPQTTRNRVLGVHTRSGGQIVFVDTPGIHDHGGSGLNRTINRTALSSIEGVDVVLMMSDARRWTSEDQAVARRLPGDRVPLMLAINKIDLLKERERLLPLIERIAASHRFTEIVPISVRSGHNVERLVDVLMASLPEGPAGFPADQITDRGPAFLAAELIREQIFNRLGDELPYQSAVEIERFQRRDDGLVSIGAVIFVDKPGQKAIVIGAGGSALKRIGQCARESIERTLGTRIHLELWVKVREGWADDARMLRSLGYAEDDV